VDAGATVAFAVLDFDGRLQALRSKRNVRRESFMKWMADFDPILIASDTHPPSKLAKRLSASFGCRLFFPPRSLTLREKYKMTSRFRPKNSHERDALAAALKAYHHVENKMRQARRHARNAGRLEAAAQASVLKGQRMSDV